MKFAIFFALFSTLVLLSTNYPLEASNDQPKLSKSVCGIANDVISSIIDTQDILIGNLGGRIYSQTLNDILRCLHIESAVVVADFKDIINVKYLRKASVIILILSYTKTVS